MFPRPTQTSCALLCRVLQNKFGQYWIVNYKNNRGLTIKINNLFMSFRKFEREKQEMSKLHELMISAEKSVHQTLSHDDVDDLADISYGGVIGSGSGDDSRNLWLGDELGSTLSARSSADRSHSILRRDTPSLANLSASINVSRSSKYPKHVVGSYAPSPSTKL